MPSPTLRPRSRATRRSRRSARSSLTSPPLRSEEFGLEAGQVGETDSVKLATVHAAKGLQWAAVFVPGLADGAAAPCFPGQAAGDDAMDRERQAAALQPAR